MSEEMQEEIRNWLKARGYSKRQVEALEGMLQCMWQEVKEMGYAANL